MEKCITNRGIVSLNTYQRFRNEVHDTTRTIMRAEQDSISKQCRSNPNKFWNYIKTATEQVDSIGDIKYVLDDGLECIAKTDKEKANLFVIILRDCLILKQILVLIHSQLRKTCLVCQVSPLIVSILIID